MPTFPDSGVSIHASAREATGTLYYWIVQGEVSIHASAREATRIPRKSVKFLTSFNPRLRTGGDVYRVSLIVVDRQFQSTPPHGRRLQEIQQQTSIYYVSIHASAREATHLGRTSDRLLGVSIHASAREATCLWQSVYHRQPVSIHASAREATRTWRISSNKRVGFNPRLRTGGDLISTPGMRQKRGFNPRLRTGGDIGKPTLKACV